MIRPVEHGGVGGRCDKLMTILMMLGISTHLARAGLSNLPYNHASDLSPLCCWHCVGGLRGKLKSGHGVVLRVNAPQVWPNKIPLARYRPAANLMDRLSVFGVRPGSGSGVPAFVLHFHFEKGTS